MGGFGDGVSALVETYTKCLALLKAFKGRNGSDSGSIDTAASNDYSRLRTSIRSDRASVRRAYSSRLSKKGDRLEKGDTRSRSALRRILDKLRAAIVNLLSLTREQRPVIDYSSLISLSNSSRSDTIRTIDQLAHRLSSSSSLLREERRLRPSTLSSNSVSSNGSSRQGRRRSRPESKAQSGKAAVPEAILTRKAPKPARSKSPAVRRSTPRQTESSRTLKKSQKYHGYTSSHRGQSSSTVRNSDTQSHHRISYVSVSSDSTKLGEIPYRRSRLVRLSEDNLSDGYAVQPVYPLHPYTAPQPEKGGFLKRMFGRRERR